MSNLIQLGSIMHIHPNRTWSRVNDWDYWKISLLSFSCCPVQNHQSENTGNIENVRGSTRKWDYLLIFFDPSPQNGFLVSKDPEQRTFERHQMLASPETLETFQMPAGDYEFPFMIALPSGHLGHSHGPESRIPHVPCQSRHWASLLERLYGVATDKNLPPSWPWYGQHDATISIGIIQGTSTQYEPC
jgi:hypothetical protein